MLTRLQMPAGKAIALAAMPTAVLMGMGLTPQLASANTRAEDRYKAGPCVSQPDEADKDAAGDKKDASDGKDSGGKGKDGKDSGGKDSGSKDQDGTSGSDKTPSAPSTPSGGGDTAPSKPTPTPTPTPSGTAGSGDGKESEEPGASPSPSASETKNPLDPLGIGDKLHDIFTPDEGDDSSAEPSATPSPSASSTTPSPSPSTERKADDPVKDTVDKVGKGVGDTTDKAKKAVEDAKDKAGKALPKPSSSAGDDGADGGKVGYPCPEFDADAYKNADTEPTASPLPDDPWMLKSTLLTLHGLDYKGIVEVRTHNGQSKKVLKFTADGVDIKDLHQLVKGPAGTTTNVAGREGSTSTFRNGTVTMYTEELKGNLLGIIPITFSPTSPPPVNIPEVFFTDVTVTQAGQFGGELTIPGMQVYKTGE